jgi:hypothetical protein
MSTKPKGSATSRMVSSVMSVATLADFFGQDIHTEAWLGICVDVNGELSVADPSFTAFQHARLLQQLVKTALHIVTLLR